MTTATPEPSGIGGNPKQAQSTSTSTARLMAYLQDGKSDNFFNKLYQSEALCLGMFRLLPALSRHVVMALLWMTSEMKSKDLKLLMGMEPNAPHEEFTRAHPLLHDLLILQTIKHKGLLYYVLHEGFKKGLRGALTGGGTTQSFGVTYKPRPNDGSVQVDLETLIDHGDTTWESLLKYMVSSQKRATAGLETPEPRVLDLLLQCGLMDHVEDDHHRRTELLKITSKGFQFLLEDRSAQIWQVLMYYIQQQGNMDREGPVLDGVEILKMLFTLSMMQLGRAYDASCLPPSQRKVLDEVEAFGLIYKRPITASGAKHNQFYPTRLATTLCSDDAMSAAGDTMGGSGETRRGFLVLETNYKIYAYTSNELEIAILNLFVDIKTRYPNLIVGRLERDTVKDAMKNGITANQIISYLMTHAHPQMHKNNPLLPITVVDQLHLWDRERNRLETNPAALFKFWRKDLYEDCLDYSQTIAALLWNKANMENSGGNGGVDKVFSGIIVVHQSLSEPFKAYIDSRRQEYLM